MVSEAHHSYSEDTYLLKPNNSPDTSVEIAVTCLTPTTPKRGKPAIVCLHGMFHNRMIWHPLRCNGLADKFVSEGYQVWLPEIRGHGRSPVNNNYFKNSFEDIIKYDLPAISDFVEEKTDNSAIWIGHTLGAFYIGGAVARGYLKQEQIKGLAFIGSQVEKPHWVLNIPLGAMISSWVVKNKPFIEGYKHGFGPENEPGKLVSEILRWQTRRGWKGGDKFDYLGAFKNINTPALVATFDMPNTSNKHRNALFENLGAEQKKNEHFIFPGSGVNFTQEHMVLGKFAQEKVYPVVISWCEQVSLGGKLQVA